MVQTVKIEELDDSKKCSRINVDNETMSKIGISCLALCLPSSGQFCKTERSLPRSSCYHLRSHFIGMGFSPTLVDEAIKEYGEEDADAILDTLITHTESDQPTNDDIKKISPLLAMKFSREEIELAIDHLGESAPVSEIVEFILSAQSAQRYGKEINGSMVQPGESEEITSVDLSGEQNATRHLLDMGFMKEEIFSALDKFGSEVPICELADSIFATRIALNCVPEEKDSVEDKNNDGMQNPNEPICLDHSTPEHQNDCFSTAKIGETGTPTSNDVINGYRETRKGTKPKHISVYDKNCLKGSCPTTGTGESMASSLNAAVFDYEKMQKGKKAKHIFACDKITSYGNKRKDATTVTSKEHPHVTPLSYKGIRSLSSGSHKFKKPAHHTTSQNVHDVLPKSPFFFYGNVVDVSQETWTRMSQFLFEIEPEYVNTQFSSVFMRREGYFHNLPRDNRFHILPKPSMTIEDALPHTKRWWPSWDTRKQFSCISLDNAGVLHICDRLEKMLNDAQGIITKEQQMDVLHQCKTSNLIWVGPHKLSPLALDQIESILGYPVQHTQIQGLMPNARLRELKCCFQTDTLGYHISVLKKMYPSGLRVLSVFSGIGGAEVALYRLGIHLKCVVSIEASQVNQKILEKWWHSTGQSGQLRQIEGIERLSSQKIETLIEEFGGFDIVIGGSPCTCAPVSGRSVLDLNPGSGRSVLDLNLFYEFVRVFQRVRSIMGRN
uniref:DNA (cytosine-5-)-methyltransferase n=1 Tax=Anthurium amnicola TaxID=1678845 RepID=A0A1D1Z3A0_9ARAE